jgi:hypothetical protein
MEDRTNTAKTRMAPRKDAPPGLEQDGCGRVTPLEQRTKEDREKARTGVKTDPKEGCKD